MRSPQLSRSAVKRGGPRHGTTVRPCADRAAGRRPRLAGDSTAAEQPGPGQGGGAAAPGGGAGAQLHRPRLDDQPPTPLHVAVIGGAGAGKSTVANLLSGALAAEANPQAGFTRHPIAYTSANGALDWAGHLGFLGPLQRLTQPRRPVSTRTCIRSAASRPIRRSFDLLKDFVVWDCPDMTTWAAAGYIPRLLEAAALADVIVYVASDERYNDEVPTQFLQADAAGGQAGRRRA